MLVCILEYFIPDVYKGTLGPRSVQLYPCDQPKSTTVTTSGTLPKISESASGSGDNGTSADTPPHWHCENIPISPIILITLPWWQCWTLQGELSSGPSISVHLTEAQIVRLPGCPCLLTDCRRSHLACWMSRSAVPSLSSLSTAEGQRNVLLRWLVLENMWRRLRERGQI